MKIQEPKPEIAKRVARAGGKAKVGQKVLVTNPDGSQYVAEILEFHERVKGWITKVKVAGKNGYEIKEVADLIVDAVMILQDITLSDVGRAIGQFFKNIFKKKA